MINHDLQDLDMAGVRWELTENSQKPSEKQVLSKPDSQTANRETIIVPPTAPVSLNMAQSLVKDSENIESLINALKEFNHPLRNGATNVVLPNIAHNPNGLVIITDFPSGEDDLSGHILSGRMGDMVDKMLAAVEMSREDVSIIPILFWRTPGGRTPTREEIDLSMPFVDKLIKMLIPRIVITFGTLATTEIAQSNLNDAHGKEITTEHGYTVVPMYHPNYLILKPSAKRDVWTALQNVQKLLKNV